MDEDTKRLTADLKRAGLGDRVIEAAWPDWWSDEAASSASARAELRFVLARRLGLSPKALLGQRVEFVWNNSARFKNLRDLDIGMQSAINSFGLVVGNLLLRATAGSSNSLQRVSASELRKLLLSSGRYVDLVSLLATCWGVSVPVIYLRVSPLATKSMHAMVVGAAGRFAILLSRDAQYPAPIAFTLAHEMGHVALEHVHQSELLVDAEDPAEVTGDDDEEKAADRFALELLTGRPNPDIETSLNSFNAAQLADAVLKAAQTYQIEPGTLALCLAYRKGVWPIAMSALRFIYQAQTPVWHEVNRVASRQINWEELGDEAAEYLGRVMGLDTDLRTSPRQ